jgi:glyoxylase-like metal-dependent hydrolase (beta-lactamase superfamily II)
MNITFKLGEFDCFRLGGGSFELDGGIMFGVVPKVLWSRKYPSTEDNHIELVNDPLLVKTPRGYVVIDTGLGNKLTDKQKAILRIKRDWDLPNELGRLGIKREDVACVIVTHCDFDHSGGVVMRNGRGGLELTFPKARHIVQRSEWEDVLNPGRRAAHSYWPENLELLGDSDNLELIDGDIEVEKGISIIHTGGHTRGHQIIRLQSGDQTAVHLSDLLPTHAHFNPLWISAYDNFPLDAIRQKEMIEGPAVREGAWFTFYHDPFMLACKFDSEGNVTESIRHKDFPNLDIGR